MTLGVSDLQSDSDLYSIRNSCDVETEKETVTETETKTSKIVDKKNLPIVWK